MARLLVACLLLGAALASALPASNKQPYHGFRVISALPLSSQHIRALRELQSWPELDFWTNRVATGEDVVFTVPPSKLSDVESALKGSGVHFKITVNDLQKVVDAEADEQAVAQRSIDGKLTFTKYLRYGEILEYLAEMEQQHPDLVKVEKIGKTTEGRDMVVARISRNNGKSKRGVFLDAGIHAREWIAPATAMYTLYQLIERAEENKDMLDDLDWYILPVMNPDGYEYTHTAQRFWRKNRRRNANSCYGVDLNRNFGFHWNENGASSNPCADTYSGLSGFSEKESQVVRDYLVNLNKDKHVKMYLTLHSYGWYILYPWGYTSALPQDNDELESIANDANDAMVKAGSRSYTIGTSTNVLYPAAGGSDDWAKAEAGIEKSYTIELPGGGSGFDPPPSSIKRIVEQTFPGFREFARRAREL